NITFNNSMRSTAFSNNQFYRSSNSEANQNNNPINRHRIWLDLISSNNMASSLLIGYIEGATNNIDKQFDGNELNGNESLINFYSLIDENKFSIQGRSIPFSDEDTVPLGFYTPQNGSFSIAINSLDGLFDGENAQNIFLEDTYTNTIHNLRTIPYSFTSENVTFNDRFILRYSDNALSINPFETDLFVITAPNNKFIKVRSGNSPISTITVYDLLGRVLIDKKDINTLEFTVNKVSQSDGVYIVKATLLNGKQKIEKVVLKL
ncbi:MAG: T9SS sorting signal type C domain-containing protein, partial [Flavobacteriaceae bacterium]|nr:T9SS sorting signal type C domain-containing protein [Flavobacteriaceae bacterium]